ncbi:MULTISPECIES: mannonate dehydratase [unclassified Devosia]|uniref:mannonate dehydratase n=1 Tax=unclassified Devosia TaxID=196773 RepID=UPI00086A0D3D|nr:MULTISPECIES: mannonate dehydratase [unclassified Devosia]MBN9364718.1 mannonate dehydratase [Devosia sp.]ODS89364.1 MAG: mannonate dehydratase [Devosia sp. SCN 66-27]OJX25579.1 MAG: mannonate dehydratase [Devosia sp. 66-14]
MYVGTQLGGDQFAKVGDRYLRQLAQLGVRHVCIDPVGDPWQWDRDILMRHAEHVDKFGLVLDMVQLPLPSSGIERQHQSPGIVLGKPGERDREIDGICRIIEALAEAGIGAAKYNFNVLGIPRTTSETGRGGAVLSTWRADQATDGDTLTIAGKVGAEEFWERIEYFLERVVPVATASKVRLACHPHDPMTPPGYRGFESRVLSSVEGLMRFVETAESPYHGLNFCQGTVAEGMEDPRSEIGEVIRWFGSRKKIFNVHFRNIKGGRYSFTEEFPDAGDMDMPAALKIYHEVGYDGMIMPDHVPHIDADNSMETAFAFCFGYIIALFQANGWDPYGA